MAANERTVGLAEALQIAVAQHETGNLLQAEDIYRKILAIEPQNANALHLLGLARHQQGDHEAAKAYIKGAIALLGFFGVGRQRWTRSSR